MESKNNPFPVSLLFQVCQKKAQNTADEEFLRKKNNFSEIFWENVKIGESQFFLLQLKKCYPSKITLFRVRTFFPFRSRNNFLRKFFFPRNFSERSPEKNRSKVSVFSGDCHEMRVSSKLKPGRIFFGWTREGWRVNVFIFWVNIKSWWIRNRVRCNYFCIPIHFLLNWLATNQFWMG